MSAAQTLRPAQRIFADRPETALTAQLTIGGANPLLLQEGEETCQKLSKTLAGVE
jgi:hypothetical protein